MSSQIVINYPDNLPDALQQTQEQFEREAKWAMAVKLYELGRISSGTVVELIGVDRVTFLLELSHYNANTFNLSEEELRNDIANA